MNFSLVYLTNREQPQFQWFVDSLCRQCADGNFPQVIFIDSCLWGTDYKERVEALQIIVAGRFSYQHHPPKPCAWQGPHRLTKRDYFAAANARNTGLCYASKDYIIYADDLSVLCPGWIDNARHAAEKGYVVQGAYRKVKNLVVEAGEIKSWEPILNEEGKDMGVDCRWASGSDTGIAPSHPGHLYGCSFGVPVEAMLEVNGQDEICDGMGYEDTGFGYMLKNIGYGERMFYNRNMLTLEDGPLHFQGEPLKREDKGKSPMDASHSLYHGTRHYPAPSGFEFGGIYHNPAYIRSIGTKLDLRQTRQDVLSGKPFPIPTKPDKHFWDGQPLSEL